MSSIEDSPVAASSATYRKAVNSISNAIDTQHSHSKYPSQDLLDIVDEIPEAMKEKALEWYERGIKRGLSKATDMMAEGKIYKDGDFVVAPSVFNIKVRTKFKGDKWEQRTVVVEASEIGFERQC